MSHCPPPLTQTITVGVGPIAFLPTVADPHAPTLAEVRDGQVIGHLEHVTVTIPRTAGTPAKEDD